MWMEHRILSILKLYLYLIVTAARWFTYRHLLALHHVTQVTEPRNNDSFAMILPTPENDVNNMMICHRTSRQNNIF